MSNANNQNIFVIHKGMAEITRVHRPFQRHNKEIYIFLLCSMSSLYMLEPRQFQSRVVSGDGPDKSQEKMKVPIAAPSLTGWLTLEMMFNFMCSHCLPLKMRNKVDPEILESHMVPACYDFINLKFMDFHNYKITFFYLKKLTLLFILQSHIFRGWSWDYKSPNIQSQSICF